MILIESKTLASDTAALSFTSIPATFDDLVVLFSFRTNRGASVDSVKAQFNSNGSGYSLRWLEGSGSAASSTSASYFFAGVATGTSNTSNTFGNAELYLPNYISANQKSGSSTSVNENNATSAFQYLAASLWTGTAAITSIELTPVVGSLILTGSTASLYGIKKGSDGIVTTS